MRHSNLLESLFIVQIKLVYTLWRQKTVKSAEEKYSLEKTTANVFSKLQHQVQEANTYW